MTSIKTETRAARTALAAVIAIAAAAVFFPAKWGFGNSIALRAEYTEVADLAAKLAPDDPQTNFASAYLREHSPETVDFRAPLAGYERAASLAPHNYLYWLELGNARTRAGETEDAEKALRRALELAPHYSAVQWALGNTILRRGQSDEAFDLFRKAASGNPIYADSAAATIWQYLDRDLEKTTAVIRGDSGLSASLVGVLAADKRLDDAFAVWTGLADENDPGDLAEIGKSLYSAMVEAKRYRDAVRILSRIEPDGGVAVDSLTNGGFENPVKMQNASPFEWRIEQGSAPLIALTDAQKHSGNLSLLIAFGGGEREQFRSISQTIAVTPEAEYVFEFHARADLKTLAEIKWEIVDAARGGVIAEVPIESPGADWKASRIEFTAPPDSDGVLIRLARGKCAVAGCAATGNIWFDDFRIIRR